MINPKKIKATLNTNVIGNSIYYYDTIDSTNTEAKRKSDCPDGSVFIADTQTSGKGRLGRLWNSKSDVGIWMSILLKPQFSTEKIPGITLVAGLSIAEVLRDMGFDAYIKWPNDIIIGTKKVCGILCEAKGTGSAIDYLILGIGINVNTPEFEEELKNKATSLFIESDTHYERTLIISNILEKFEKYYDILKTDGVSGFMDKYKNICITLGKKITVVHPDGDYEAEALSVNNLGELVIEKNGEIISINSYEVSVRGLFGYV